MPLLTVFQLYHGDSSHYSCFSWVSPVLGWALKCLAQGHSHEKTQRIQCDSNPGLLDYESNTLPLSHAGPTYQQERTKKKLRKLSPPFFFNFGFFFLQEKISKVKKRGHDILKILQQKLVLFIVNNLSSFWGKKKSSAMTIMLQNIEVFA